MICLTTNRKDAYLYQMQAVQFVESSHQYFVDKQEYISATTLIERYVEPFDSEFWSRYKAVEQIFKDRYGDSKGQEYFLELRAQRSYKSPGWESWICKIERIPEPLVDEIQEEILQQWKDENRESLRKGSAYHNEREDEAYRKGRSINPFNDKSYATAHRQGVRPDPTKLTPGYYPEIIIWNNEYKVIGTADRLFVGYGTRKDPRLQIWIDDYKTNKEIKKQNPYQTMRFPLEKLADCNYNHYRLQIGLYAWMFEQQGYHVRGISISHLNADEDIERHKMRYSSIKPYVQAMLDHHVGKDLAQLPGVLKYGFTSRHLNTTKF